MNKPEDLEFPTDFFDPPTTRPESWPDNPELDESLRSGSTGGRTIGTIDRILRVAQSPA